MTKNTKKLLIVLSMVILIPAVCYFLGFVFALILFPALGIFVWLYTKIIKAKSKSGSILKAILLSVLLALVLSFVAFTAYVVFILYALQGTGV